MSKQKLGFLGPVGTFTEEALLSQKDLADLELVPCKSMPEVLAMVEDGSLDLGFVALENSIEGTVNVSLDALIFERELYIQREVVFPIRMNLMAAPGVKLEDVKRVVSFPHAAAQCRNFIAEKLPNAEFVAANSTADAAREIGENKPENTAAIANSLAAKLYSLDLLAEDVEDHEDNATRFVVVAKDSVPAATGHDKTSIACFQRDDHPGSLHAILGEFSARAINLSKLESRPTKTGLGDYCFIIDLDGHVSDEVVADCLKSLQAFLANVKFLGSYPAAGEHGDRIRAEAKQSWKDAEGWLDAIRAKIRK